MYQIGDRRFPWFADYFQDPRGSQPREVRDNGIQPVIDMHPATGDVVMARCDWTSGGGGMAAGVAKQPDWDFAQGAYPTADELPRERFWRILLLGTRTATNPHDVRVALFGGSPQDGWTTLAQLPFKQYAAGGSYPEIRTDFTGLALPYGGYLTITATVGVDTGYVTAFAVGYLRGSTALF